MMRLYSIYDSRSHSYGVPFVAVDDSVAQRTVAAAMMNVPDDHLYRAFANDFELRYLGDLTDDGALMQDVVGGKSIVWLSDLKVPFVGGDVNEVQNVQ